MKRLAILALVLCAPLAYAQSQPYGQEGSRHCDQLSGTQKEQCLKAEGAKTEPKALGDSAAAGASTPKDGADSARCDQMTGEQREQCLNDEGAKTQGAASPAR
jgi:hypothetical protein